MPDKEETDSKGIPLKGPYPPNVNIVFLYFITTGVFLGLMGTVCYFTIVKDNEAADEKLKLLAQYDLGYLYAALVSLFVGQFVMGINTGNARKYCKAKSPDQHVYEVKGAEGSKLGYVLMDTEGVNGRFNRAQRAVQNYNETFPMNALFIVFAGFVYPKEVMILTFVFAVSRVISAWGYTSSSNGRMPGFMLSNFAMWSVASLNIMIAYKLLS